MDYKILFSSIEFLTANWKKIVIEDATEITGRVYFLLKGKIVAVGTRS